MQSQQFIQVRESQAQVAQIQQQIKSSIISCIRKCLAQNVCLNSNCNQYAFLCLDKTCQCNKKHKGCIKGSIQSIMEALTERIISIEPLENKINDLVDKAIDDLSNFRDRILVEAKSKLQYVGLTKNQQKFLKAIKNGQINQITGKQIHDVNLSINNLEEFQNDLKKIQEKTLSIWNNFNLQLKKCFLGIDTALGTISQNQSTHFKDSKVISSSQDTKKLLNFFKRKVQLTSLLYRASQNDFDIKRFFENCQNIGDTVVICQTQFGKVIGGYTPLKWKYNNHQSNYTDQSGQSFVFSLTNNDKFSLYHKSRALRTYSGCGPMLGGGQGTDFFIADKANLNASSGGNLNNAYYNSKYNNGDPKSWLKFTGSQKDFRFIAKQWQVWSLQFL